MDIKRSGKREKKRREDLPKRGCLGLRIRAIRKEKGWTQKNLGDRLGVNSQTISRWERGDNDPELQALPVIASVLGVSADFLLDSQIKHERTQYEEKYQQAGFYWGEAVWEAAYEVLRLMPAVRPVRLLDMGCGEGQAAVFFARNGYTVDAFDLAATGLKKGRRLAADAGVRVNFFQASLLGYKPSENFDVVYGSGVLGYIPPRSRRRVIENLKAHTSVGGLNVFNAFVEKSFIETPPDWDAKKETFWQSGELFTYYGRDWKLELAEETIINCGSGGVPHQHCMDVVIARKMA